MRLRKSKSIGPFRITATGTGLSLSAGVPGARVSANTRGEVRATGSLPGTGISHTKRLDGGAAAPAEPTSAPETDRERRARLVAARHTYRANVKAGMPKSEARALLRAANTWKRSA